MEQTVCFSIIGISMMLSLAALATGLGFALLGGKFLEGVARQPEVAPILQTNMFIVAGLLDAIPMITVAIALFFTFANPFFDLVN